VQQSHVMTGPCRILLIFAYLQVLSSKKEGNTQNGTAKEGNEGGSIKDNREEGVVEEETSDVQSVVQALTELVSVQTPASVWLPNKHLTFQHSGKVRPHCKSLHQIHGTVSSSFLPQRTLVPRPQSCDATAKAALPPFVAQTL
jgi:hypothetical protein